MSSIKMQRRLSRLVHILLMIQGTPDSSMQWSGKQVDTHIPHLKTAPRLPSNSLLIKECRNSVTSGKRWLMKD
jgi:carbohydrate ABC transporter substrate-binding protein, CUT1 family (TC 3.A.1.1.-)